FDVTPQVIDWTSGNVPNNGVLLGAAPSAPGNSFAVSFYSSEAAQQKPYLRVCYAPSACAGKPNGTACTDGHRCTTGTCQSGTCQGQPAAAGMVCRAAYDKCDAQEVCNG